jgi:hypothetical protein
MSLWGASTTDESKPKHLTDAEKRDVYATNEGWVKRTTGTGDRAGRVHEEILVAISDLAGGTSATASLGTGTISSINWNISAFDKSEGGTLSVTVNYNEEVTVTGTPQLTVVNNAKANHTLSYASGTGTNRLIFTLAIGAANAATDAGNVLSVGANAMALNSGTVKDKGTNVTSTITNSAGIGTKAGTITVVA